MSCQYCGSSEVIKSSASVSENIEIFLKHTKVQIPAARKSEICFNCYQSITRFSIFIKKVIGFREGTVKNVLGKVPKGITIKKVTGGLKNYSTLESHTANDPLNVESVFVKSEPVDSHEINFEPEPEQAREEEPMETYESEDNDGGDSDYGGASLEEEKRITDLNFTCAKCKKSYGDFDALMKHITSRACGPDILKCPFCPKMFEDRKKFSRHKITHVMKEKESTKMLSFNCSHCPMVFKSSADLKAHMETHRGDVTAGITYRCIQCQATFNSQLKLINHTKEEHPKRRKK